MDRVFSDNRTINLLLSLFWTVLWWAIAWSRVPILSSISFLPLWLGFIFSINCISEYWFNDSLVKHLKSRFIWLFIISIPFWWGFEWVNDAVVHNWYYTIPNLSQSYGSIIKASLDFSTVIPAISSVIYMFYCFKPAWHPKNNKYSPLTLLQYGLIEFIGFLSLILLLYFPHECFALVWITPILIIDPINYMLGNPSIIRLWQSRNIKTIGLIAFSGLFTGAFWEMWNYFSLPKWFYHVPYIGSPRIFEMPVLGYLGYLPFALLIWSYCHLLRCYKRNSFI